MAIKAWGPLFALVGMVAIISTGLVIEHSKPHDQAQPAQANSSNKEAGKAAADLSGPEHSKERNKKSYWYDPFLDHLTDWLLVLFNGVLAAFTVRLFYAAAEQSRDMKASIAVADKALIAAHRPWIKAVIAGIAVDVSVGDRGITTILEIRFVNIGHSPAKRIRLIAEYVGPPYQSDIKDGQRRLCERHRADSTEKGFFLFPDEFRVETVQANARFDDPNRTFNAATVAVCIAYDTEVSNRTYITSFVVTGRAPQPIGPIIEHWASHGLPHERHFPREIVD